MKLISVTCTHSLVFHSLIHIYLQAPTAVSKQSAQDRMGVTQRTGDISYRVLGRFFRFFLIRHNKLQFGQALYIP